MQWNIRLPLIDVLFSVHIHMFPFWWKHDTNTVAVHKELVASSQMFPLYQLGSKCESKIRMNGECCRPTGVWTALSKKKLI